MVRPSDSARVRLLPAPGPATTMCVFAEPDPATLIALRLILGVPLEP